MNAPTRAIIAGGARNLSVGEVAVADLGPSDVLVRISTGGICGSDLHYYQHGGFGTVRIKAPLVLGHELAGTIEAVGSEVVDISPGDRVAVNPSLACGTCAYCRVGLQNHCLDMRFMGSAMRSPHIQGGFRDRLVCSAAQAYKIPDDLSFGEAALAEPTAVCLHALSRAGDLVGKRVLITGAGPIGLLMVAVCRLAGAKYIVATDRLDRPLQMAMKMGADATINVSESEGHLGASAERDSLFEVLFEASGNPQALLDGISALGPRGIGVLIGQGAEVPLQVSKVIGRELDLRGSFRFDREFGSAIGYLASGRLRVANLITATLPASEAVSAFDLALDKTVSVKVQLAFT